MVAHLDSPLFAANNVHWSLATLNTNRIKNSETKLRRMDRNQNAEQDAQLDLGRILVSRAISLFQRPRQVSQSFGGNQKGESYVKPQDELVARGAFRDGDLRNLWNVT